MICRTKIDTAYNDLCFDCYKRQKAEKRCEDGKVKYSTAQ